jgi:DNA polymerase-3 subunit gamma/tau
MSDATQQSEPADVSVGRYTVIARRYRPQSFDELVGQEHVARALQQAITSERVGHAYLFTGARVTGKTSDARILAKALNCVEGPTPTPCNQCDVCRSVATGDDVDVLEIDGASNRGIDEIRQLRQNVAVRPSRVRFKIYIIDEVHMLTKEAFNALLKTLEEPPEHVKFIFATTEAQKIPITILSRCQRFDFAGISSAAIQSRLAQIATSEGVQIQPEALQILASRAAGSMRDSQSLLEQLLAVGRDTITAADVNQLLGIAPAERLSGLVKHLVGRDAAAALAELDSTLASGVEVGLLLDQLVGHFRDVMTAAVGCPADQMLYALPSQAGEVAEVGRRFGLATILAIGQILDQAAARMRVTMHGRTLVEMALVRICQLDELEDLAAVVAELRGAASDTPAAVRPSGTNLSGASTTAKKNVDPMQPLATGLASAFQNQVLATGTVNTSRPSTSETRPPITPPVQTTSEPVAMRLDPAHVNDGTELDPGQRSVDPASAGPSVLAQWKQALANPDLERVATGPPRPSRREQLAAVAERPFVERAIELFNVSPVQIKYSPPEGDQSQ